MTRISEFILNFLVNSAWQVVAICALAALGTYLLKKLLGALSIHRLDRVARLVFRGACNHSHSFDEVRNSSGFAINFSSND